MSEPKTLAKRLRQAVAGVFNWHVMDDRIGARSDAHAVTEGRLAVLIDPLALEPAGEVSLSKLGRIEAICLTGSCHQRSAWRYRRKFSAKVYAPQGAQGLEESPDVSYAAGERLPGGLVALHAPGPTQVHYAFYRSRGGVLFCADVLVHPTKGKLGFVSDEHQDDPARTRQTAKQFLHLMFKVLCFDHGAPLATGGRRSIKEALSEDASTK